MGIKARCFNAVAFNLSCRGVTAELQAELDTKFPHTRELQLLDLFWKIRYFPGISNFHHNLSCLVGKPTWFPNRSDTNRAVQSQKTARSMKFCIYEVEGLYYPCSENKGADQLRGYREADLRLCFRKCRLLVFPWGGSFIPKPMA